MLDFGHDGRAIRDREKLGDVPQVLGPARKEFQENQIHATHNGDLNTADLRIVDAVQDPCLPCSFRDDDVKGTLVRDSQPYDSGERIVDIAAPNIHMNSRDNEAVPESWNETVDAHGQQVDIAR